MSTLSRFRKLGVFSLILVIAVGLAGLLQQPQQDAVAATSPVYCAASPKYACTRFIYSASGYNWTMYERNWKGSRGCAFDQNGMWTCGAVRWRMLSAADRYVSPGAGSWTNGYGFGPYGWEYNDTLPSYWRVSSPDRYYWAELIGTWQYFQYERADGTFWSLMVYASA
jgi:hypothetical protein